jgi:methylmalonyl-CoA mutase N-terminal domain/subunit
MFLENIRSPLVYILSREREKILLVCLQVREDRERTNKRFHYVSAELPAKRLSTAFDSVTLYGNDPHTRPDIYGKIGNAGVSICCLDDAKKLYSGFDLVHA